MNVRKRGLRLGKVPFTDLAWQGELIKDLKRLKADKHKLQCDIDHRIAELERYEKGYELQKKEFVEYIDSMLGAKDRLLDNIENHEIEIAKLKPKKKVKPKPVPEKVPEHIIVPKKLEPKKKIDIVAESLKETIEDITEEIVEHQEKTITAVKKAINNKFEQTIIEGKILCPECILEGKQESESLFTKGGAFIAHYKSHFKEANGGV